MRRQINGRFFIGLVMTFVFVNSAPALEDRVIAVVNNQAITLSELKSYVITGYLALKQKGLDSRELERLKADLENNGLDRLIEDRLILAKANEMKIKVSERTVDDRLSIVKKQYPSEQAFIDALTQSGTTLSDLKQKFADQLKVRMFVDSYVRSQVKVNPNEVIRYYKEHLESYWRKDSVDLDSLFIAYSRDKDAAKERLDQAVTMIKSGGNFLEASEKYSDSPSIGIVQKGDLVSKIEEVVFKLNEGQVSPVIETDDGYYLFQAKKKIPMEVTPFQDVKDNIENQLYQRKFKAQYKEFLDELEKESYVEIKP